MGLTKVQLATCDNQFFGSIALRAYFNSHTLCKCRCSSICTQQVQNNQKHFSDVILKLNHAHLALAAAPLHEMVRATKREV